MRSDVEQLLSLLRKNSRYQIEGFSDAEIDSLSRYYELVLKWNERLSLTTLTQPSEFLDRHIMESVFAESLILKTVDQVWDIGSGLGVPGIVIAIIRSDLNVNLVEANLKKSIFLDEAAYSLGLKNVRVIKSRFEALEEIPARSCLTVRAIEGMEKMLPEILKSAASASQILILGAISLEEKLRGLLNAESQIESLLITGSDRRFVINIFRST